MLNHFASLLGNLKSIDGQGPSGLSGPQGALTYSPLVATSYTALDLPPQLQKVYDILFQSGISEYYSQFLLYSYLRLIAATDRQTDILNYDKRVSYNLDDSREFFRTPRLSKATSTDPSYELLLSGIPATDTYLRAASNQIAIRQVDNTAKILVYSLTQGEYLKRGQPPTKHPENKDIAIEASSTDPSVTAPIFIGDTDITFSIAGDISNFLTTYDKAWTFHADAPFIFPFQSVISELRGAAEDVQHMFDYERPRCNLTYENLWNMHYNDVYRLAGLLLAYVERVNTIWQKRAT